MEVAVLMVIGLLLFGKRLPEMGRSLGRTVISFREAMSGIENPGEPDTYRSPPLPPERMPPPRFEGPSQDAHV
jgi:sec-independent protein translocase protein TatA